MLRFRTLILLSLITWPAVVNLHAQDAPAGFTLDLRDARVIVSDTATPRHLKAVEMLRDEVRKRTQILWSLERAADPSSATDKANTPAADKTAPALQIIIRLAPPAAGVAALPAEGFRIQTASAADRLLSITIEGADDRGLLFGVGRLLRALHMSRGRVALPEPLNLTSSPGDQLRGHQLGYRPKTNSYDAWDLPQWEQYIRDLAVFGVNTIELIPPRSDDDDDSPHFPRPKLEMMVGMSQLADDYGLDVWLWYPAMDGDYTQPEQVRFALTEWREVLRQLPRVDALFVPSGDPGDAAPEPLMAMLEPQAAQLRELHPRAGLWITMQSFTQSEFERMLAILRKEPAWLAGIGFGPQTRVTLPELRRLLPARYPIRRYPDITHSLRCEYPVPDWDRALAFTEARETINPRPVDEAIIYRAYREGAIGTVTYSEGCNDDVNKFVWSGLGWNPDARVEDILEEYGRYFIGPEYAAEFRAGLLGLEQNWRGALAKNESVERTLATFRALEQRAAPAVKLNWRFQQALYRAYYDAYIQRRLRYETAYEAEALAVLAEARARGSEAALAQAQEILDRPTWLPGFVVPVSGELRARIFELAEALFQSIRMQLSVPRYQAIDVGRGANLDTVDVPLNNRLWLEKQFAQIRHGQDERERLAQIERIVHWTDPGPGGFYDDLGDPQHQPHLVRNTPYAADPGFLHSPTVAFRYEPTWRLAWCTHVDGLYETPVEMRYTELDPKTHYRLRVVYAGDNFTAEVRLTADDGSDDGAEIHPWIKKPTPVAPVEFAIPPALTADGELLLTWRATPGRGGPGRGCQVAEVWLLAVPAANR